MFRPRALNPGFLSRYEYMLRLQRLYHSPHSLLYCPKLHVPRKSYLLKKWRDERAQYIFEHGRDYDYLRDAELEEVMQAVKVAKAALSAEEITRLKIRIYHLKFLK